VTVPPGFPLDFALELELDDELDELPQALRTTAEASAISALDAVVYLLTAAPPHMRLRSRPVT